MKKIKEPKKIGVAKVPVIMQLEALECGAASLTMVLAYYGKWIPLEQIRIDCGVSRDGSNAKNVLKAARSYGLEVEAFRYGPDSLKKKGTFPCIIHWNFNHFVVLDGFKKDKAVLNDPARGRVEVSMKEFDASFTGICLFLKPSAEFEPSGKQKSIWEYVKKQLSGAKIAVVFVVLTTVITSIVNIINPMFSNIFVDRLLSGKNREWIWMFLIGLGLFCVVQLVAGWINAIYSLKLQGKLAITANARFMWHTLNLPMEFYSQRLVGDIVSRKESNESIAQSLIDTLVPLSLNSLMMILYLVVMVRYSVFLTLIGVCGIILNLIISKIVTEKRMNINRVMMRDSSKLWAATIAGIDMIESIKSSGSEEGFFERWAGFQSSVNTQKVRGNKINQYIGMIPTLILQIVNVLVLWGGVCFILKGEFTVGMLLAFQGFLSAFIVPAKTVLEGGQKLQEMRVNMERIEDVMEYPKDIISSKESELPTGCNKLSGKIELKNVTFGYSRLAPPLIENFNMVLEPGKKVALIGASGCGKSTISKLISGLYKPWSGEILFDGIPLEEINHDIFTSSVAVVDQDITLFEGSINSNIKMWDDSIENFEMVLAAKDAGVLTDILKRDGGFEYHMLEGGRDFSGGQRQRIEIARVLAQDPTIIIMDEATSALDAKTEFEVVDSIQKRGISCVVVAHRLSTVKDCDEIIVLNRGKIVERGNHATLMSQNGHYSNLIRNE